MIFRSNFSSFPQNFQYISNFRSQITYSFVKCAVRFIVFRISANLICRGTDISKCFSESLGIRDNESRLYFNNGTQQPTHVPSPYSQVSQSHHISFNGSWRQNQKIKEKANTETAGKATNFYFTRTYFDFIWFPKHHARTGKFNIQWPLHGLRITNKQSINFVFLDNSYIKQTDKSRSRPHCLSFLVTSSNFTTKYTAR